MLRRTRCGDVVRPFRSVYARREYWDGLNPIEQASHVIREMARRHPERVFAGLSAAVIYGFEHSWTLHDEPYVYIATDGFTKSRRSYHRLRRISVRRSDIREDCHVVRLYRPRGDGAAQDGSNTWSQVSKLADRIAHERALRDNVMYRRGTCDQSGKNLGGLRALVSVRARAVDVRFRVAPGACDPRGDRRRL